MAAVTSDASRTLVSGVRGRRRRQSMSRKWRPLLAAVRTALISSSVGGSLRRYPTAPERSASLTRSLPEKEVSMSTLVSGHERRRKRVASMPSMFGIDRSMRTTSGECLRLRVPASTPSEASPITSMSSVRWKMSASPRRTTGWSSTMRRRILLALAIAPNPLCVLPAPAPVRDCRAQTRRPPGFDGSARGPWSGVAGLRLAVSSDADRRPDLHEGPPTRCRFDAEAAAAVGDGPLEQAETHVALIQPVRLLRGVEAAPVVDDPQDDVGAVTPDLDGEVLRVRVLHGVAHRLLGDPVEEPVGAVAEGEALLHIQPGVDARAEVDQKILERGLQAQFLQLRRGDLDDQAAQIAGRTARGLGALGDELQEARPFLTAQGVLVGVGVGTEAERQPRQVLDDAVVDGGGNALPFLVGGVDGPLEETDAGLLVRLRLYLEGMDLAGDEDQEPLPQDKGEE